MSGDEGDYDSDLGQATFLKQQKRRSNGASQRKHSQSRGKQFVAPPEKALRKNKHKRHQKQSGGPLAEAQHDFDNMGGNSKKTRDAGREASAREQLKQKEKDFQAQEKENKELRKLLEEMQKGQEPKKKEEAPPPQKKIKLTGFVPKAVEADDAEGAMIQASFQDNVLPDWKFIGDTDEEVAAMKTCLQHCPPIWRELEKLPEDHQREQIKEYVLAYKPTTKVNDKRNSDQQKVRRVFIDAYKEGIRVNDKLFLNALKRPERMIEVLPEKDDKGEPLPNNVAANEKNKRQFQRLVDFVDQYLGAVVGKGLFGPDTRSNHPVSTLRRQNGKGQLVVTPGTEALILCCIENAIDKWIYEANLEMTWGRKIKEQDRKHETYKKHCPPCLWTTKKVGNHRFGGWQTEGKARFKKVRGFIEKARAKEHVNFLEQKVCEEIKKRHEAMKKEEKAKKKGDTVDLSGTVGTVTGEVADEDDYDSDAEAERITKVCTSKMIFNAPSLSEEEHTPKTKPPKDGKGKKATQEDDDAIEEV